MLVIVVDNVTLNVITIVDLPVGGADVLSLLGNNTVLENCALVPLGLLVDSSVVAVPVDGVKVTVVVGALAPNTKLVARYEPAQMPGLLFSVCTRDRDDTFPLGVRVSE